jgi:hypothetical protein
MELGEIVRCVITAGKEHATVGFRGNEHERNNRTFGNGVFYWVRARLYRKTHRERDSEPRITVLARTSSNFAVSQPVVTDSRKCEDTYGAMG